VRLSIRRAFLGGMILSLAVAADGTQLRPATLEQMWDAADVVVVGRVAGARGRLHARRPIVLTHATLVVEDVLKGEVKGGAVHLVVPGGTDGEVWTEVPGAPDTGPPGGRVLAFLYADEGDRLSNVVFWQGLYHIEGGRVRENGRDAAAFLEEVRGLGRRRGGSR
jgi:hypothetical protein